MFFVGVVFWCCFLIGVFFFFVVIFISILLLIISSFTLGILRSTLIFIIINLIYFVPIIFKNYKEKKKTKGSEIDNMAKKVSKKSNTKSKKKKKAKRIFKILLLILLTGFILGIIGLSIFTFIYLSIIAMILIGNVL